MNQHNITDSMNQPIPDILNIQFYKDCILTEAKERIYELLDNKRETDAQAMVREWML